MAAREKVFIKRGLFCLVAFAVSLAFSATSIEAARLTIHRGDLVPSMDKLPFLAQLVTRKTRCTAVLISSRLILTAGHCFCGIKEARADFGARAWWSSGQARQVVNFAMPKDYAKECQLGINAIGGNDIGVGLLELPVNTESASVGLAKLDYDGEVKLGDTFMIAGYGHDQSEKDPDLRSGILKTGHIRIGVCFGSYAKGVTCSPNELSPSGQYSAGGDSGGPLLRLDERNSVVGIVSGSITWKLTNKTYEESVFVTLQDPAIRRFLFAEIN